MNHGLLLKIDKILEKESPLHVNNIARRIEPPDGWYFKKVLRNISSLCAQYAKRGKWLRVSRGCYSKRAIPSVRRELIK